MKIFDVAQDGIYTEEGKQIIQSVTNMCHGSSELAHIYVEKNPTYAFKCPETDILKVASETAEVIKFRFKDKLISVGKICVAEWLVFQISNRNRELTKALHSITGGEINLGGAFDTLILNKRSGMIKEEKFITPDRRMKE